MKLIIWKYPGTVHIPLAAQIEHLQWASTMAVITLSNLTKITINQFSKLRGAAGSYTCVYALSVVGFS